MVSTGGGIVIAILVILLVSALAWVIFTQLRARRLGIPPPTLTSYIPFLKSDQSPYSGSSSSSSSGGPLSWLTSRFHALKNRNSRSAPGAYEPPARGNFGPLDPDEAWDARVHDYGYEEEFETGYRGAGDRDLGSGYEMNVPEERGRGRGGRNPFEDDVAVAGAEDPFGDGEAIRGVSPRPMERRSEERDRRSAFREEV